MLDAEDGQAGRLLHRAPQVGVHGVAVGVCAHVAAHSLAEAIAAQARKLDYLCRKLRLRPGERMLDIGCGWGGLIIHAEREYGVQAFGITLSKNQAQLANERIARARGWSPSSARAIFLLGETAEVEP